MNDNVSEHNPAEELKRTLNMLSSDAEQAALDKAQQAGFDATLLKEILTEMTDARDVLVDAERTGIVAQLPRKLQQTLQTIAQDVERELTAISNGSDAVKNLSTAVDELNAVIWQYQLQNRSSHILGLQAKVKQLKAQEATIREAVRAAERSTALLDEAVRNSARIAEQAKSIADAHEAAARIVTSLEATERVGVDVSQRVTNTAAQIAQHETTATQQLASAKQAVADTEAIAAKSAAIQADIDAERATLQQLVTRANELSGYDGSNLEFSA